MGKKWQNSQNGNLPLNEMKEEKVAELRILE